MMRPQRFLRALACVGSLAAGGCEATTEPEFTAVRVRVLDENVIAGGSSTVHLVNNTAFDWSVSPCPVTFERLGEAGWEAVAVPECSEEGYVSLSGGEPHVAQLKVPLGSKFGVYRAVYDAWVYIPGESFAPFKPERAVSNRFYVPAIR